MFHVGPHRYQPDPAHAYQSHPAYVVDQRWLATGVGVVSVALPCVMWLSTFYGNCFFWSISHFYYAPYVGQVFTGAIVFLGTFLLAYRGETRAESRLATLAGVFAMGVAAFPTSAWGCSLAAYKARTLSLVSFTAHKIDAYAGRVQDGEPVFLTTFAWSATVHFICAGLLFGCLAWYSFFVFTRVAPGRHLDADGRVLGTKRWRNALYILTGVIIVLSMALIAGHSCLNIPREVWNAHRGTFWCETAALWAFGAAWLIKGRAGKSMLTGMIYEAR